MANPGGGAPLGPGQLQVQQNPNSLGSTVNGLPQSVTAININTTLTIQQQVDPNAGTLIMANPNSVLVGPSSINPMSTLYFPSAVPALNSSTTPANVGSLGGAPSTWTYYGTPVAMPSLAHARPDFNYVAAKLAFEKTDTSTTGQRDLGVGAGIPAGETRFVPVGEF